MSLMRKGEALEQPAHSACPAIIPGSRQRDAGYRLGARDNSRVGSNQARLHDRGAISAQVCVGKFASRADSRAVKSAEILDLLDRRERNRR